MTKLTQEEKGILLDAINAKMSKASFNKALAIIDKIEVESEPYFKKGEEVLMWDTSGEKRPYIFSRLNGSLYEDTNDFNHSYCSKFSEWIEYKGINPLLPEGAKGLVVRFNNGFVATIYEPDYNANDFDSGVGKSKIVDYYIWK